MPHSYKLNPIGCNMNDASYPFRGEYKLDDCINHGHSGVTKHPPTSLSLKISGSNLVIEKLQAPKGLQLACDLGVDGGVPRAVTLGKEHSSMTVPGDGREYQLTAVVKGENNMKHYCRMSFNGSEGKSTLRVRAPDGVPPKLLQLIVDGKPLKPLGGWFVIPLHAAECRLVVNLPEADNDFTGHTRGYLADPAGAPEASLSNLPGAGAVQRIQVPASFILQTVTGEIPDKAALVCTATGQTIPLNENEAVTVPGGAGPYRLSLPKPAPAAPAPPAAAIPAPGASSALPAASNTGVPAPVPIDASGASMPAIELETRVHDVNGTPSFSVYTREHYIQLTAENGSTVSGLAAATVPLPHGRAQVVQVVLTDSKGRVLLKQRQHIPAQQMATGLPAVSIQLQEDPSGVVVRGTATSRISVSSMPSQLGSARVETSAGPQSAKVEQTNPDGSVTTATLTFGTKQQMQPPLQQHPPQQPVPAGIPSSAAQSPPMMQPAAVPQNPYSPSITPMQQAAPAPEPWIAALVQALEAPSFEEAKRLVQQIYPTSAAGTTITHFVRDQLLRDAPVLSFVSEQGSLTGVRCNAFNVSARVGADPSFLVPPSGTVPMPPGARATLTAVNPQNGRVMAGCEVQLGASIMNTQHSAPADDPLVSRLIDVLQRHNMDAQKVASELATIPGSSLSTGGKRLVPLLVNALRSIVAAPNEDILFTCGNGFLENIYTLQPHYQITASIDSAPAAHVPQRGRIPATSSFVGAQPHFVKLVATDPISGTVKSQVSLTVMGPTPSSSPTAASPHSVSPLSMMNQPRQAIPEQPSGAPSGAPSPTHYSGQPQAPSQPQPAPYTSAPHPAMAAPQQQQAPESPHNGNKLPYLDVTLQNIGAEAHMRFISRPDQRIVCDVDGVGGDTGVSDFVAKMPSSRQHRIEVSLVDCYGRVVFQQRLEVPAMTSSHWGIALQDNGLSVDPDNGCTTTVALDRTAERSLQGNFVHVETSAPHFLVLRKYANGAPGGPSSGELALRLPAFISPKELEELTQLYRSWLAGEMPEAVLRDRLVQLYQQSNTPAMRDLVQALLQAIGRGAVAAAGGGGGATSAVSPTSGRVYFRLTGSD